MHATTYGLDAAKRVFQMYWVDNESGEVADRRFGRDDLIQYLSRQSPGRVALEPYGSAHWWARKIKALGHDVVLLLGHQCCNARQLGVEDFVAFVVPTISQCDQAILADC